MSLTARHITLLALIAAFWLSASHEAMGQYFSYGKNKVQYDAQEWRYLQTAHFDVYYYDEGKPLALFAARAAEEAFARLQESLSTGDDTRIPILIYRGHQRFANTNAVDLPEYAEGIGGVTERYKNRIAVPFTGSYRRFERVVQHEVVHAVINEAFYGGTVQSMLRNNIRFRLPLWFEEGLAEHVAVGWNAEADMYIREALLENRLSPPGELSGFMAYKAGQSLWYYIAEQYGAQAVNQILADLQLSRSVERSVTQATGLSVDELSERWVQALREVHYPEVTTRQGMGDIASAVITRKQGTYHASPALSPQGDRVAYVTARGGLFDVYVAEAQSGRPIRRLVEGQTSTMFESLRLQTPGLAWSPDGTQLAVAVTSGPTEAVTIIDAESGEVKHHRLHTIDQVNALEWGPRGKRIAMSASSGSQGDIFVLDLATGNLANITDDVFSDHEPSWHPGGKRLLFHSDRGAETRLRTRRAELEDMLRYRSGTYDIYEVTLDGGDVRRLTHASDWSNRSARYSPDGRYLLYLSDRNGISNLYRKDLETLNEQAVTDVLHGILQFSISSDGQRAALLSLEGGAPSIYLMRRPFQETIRRSTPNPTVWAWRTRSSAAQAPAVAVAAEVQRQRNPFLRSAIRPLYADRSADGVVDPSSDSLAYGGIRIDLDQEESSAAGSELEAGDAVEQALSAYLREDGSPEDHGYRLKFSPDLIYGATGFDAVYGVQGLVQTRFSDMMGNHRIAVSTNLLLDLRNADYSLSYHYMARRTDWSITSYHTARLLPDYQARTYHRFRRYGASIRASYPLDKFKRIDVDGGVVGASQADIGDPSAPLNSQIFFSPGITYTRDLTTPGRLAPSGGNRFAINVTGGWGSQPFATVLADGRQYISFDDRAQYTLALRGAGGTSLGQLRQLYFASGVQNWLNRGYDPAEGFPIGSVSDFIFASPVVPLRGHGFNAKSGAHFLMANAELRFPLITAIEDAVSSLLPISDVRGAAFTDAAAMWDGRQAGDVLRFVRTAEDGTQVLDDLMVGAGIGVRSLVFGYPVRMDVAWPYDGQRFGQHHWYLSIGFDF